MVLPVINGTAQIGETLTADTSGIEDPNGLARVQFRFQWISSDGGTDTVITDATDSSYTPVATDEGNTIKVRVDFTDRGGYAESLTSAATASVTSAVEGSSGGEIPQNSPATGAPTISGIARVGETLTADTSGIADGDGLTNVTYSYQWIANDSNSDSVITDATNSTYTLVAADEGKTIKVRVDFTDDAGNAETLTSASTSSVAAKPNNQATGAPAISGTAQVGETLTADTSGIADSDGLTNVSYSYQWISNDGNSDSGITDATGSSYTLAADDEGKTIKVRVDFTDDAGNAETLTSATTGEVVGAPLTMLVPPSDDGERRVQKANAGSLDGALNVFWLNGDNLGSVKFDRYLVAWKSGDEEFQTDLDGDRVKVVMGRNQGNVILEGLTNGTQYTVRVTHANAVGPAIHHSHEATATPAERVRELVSNFAQNPGWGGREPMSVRTNRGGEQFVANYFTTGPGTERLGSVTFLRVIPQEVGEENPDSTNPGTEMPRNLVIELQLTEDDGGIPPYSEPSTVIGTFISPPEYVDGTVTFIAPGDGFALSPSTKYWLKLAIVTGEVEIVKSPSRNEDPTGESGWLLGYPCFAATSDVPGQYSECRTGALLLSLNKPIDSALPLASISGGSAVEGQSIEFTVELSSAPGAQATIQYDTVDGSGLLPATSSDNDYTAVSGETITFAAGETSKTISIATGDDSTDEPNERFLVRLSNPSSNIVLGELDTAAGVIINDDYTTASNSTLAGITLTDRDGNAITLKETFNRYGFVYTADAAGSVDTINMSVTFDAGVNPNYLRYFDAFGKVAEGTKSQAGSATFSRVEPGLNLLKVLVTSNDRTQESLYEVTVTRTASSDATIATLVLEDNNLNDFVLSPAFSPSVTEYTATVGNNPPYYVDVGLNHGGADAEVSVNGTVVVPYSLAYPADTFDMPAGENTLAIEVTAEDGTVQTYTFTLVPPATPSRPTIESVAHNSVTITWDDPGDTSITGYQVLRRNPAIHDSGVFDVIEDDTGSSDTRYTDTTVSPETTYRYRVKARNAHGLSERSQPAARFTTPPDPTPPNAAPTGLPTITGTPQVGQTLSADTSGISDSNGLNNVQYAYQWIRNDGNTDEEISGATGQTYTLTRDDQGNTVKVSVSFTDDDGYAETLTSAATGTVDAPANPERTFVELSGGSSHMCGIATDGSLHCWGENHRGQIDPPAGAYKALASGSVHTCAIATDGSIDCWGWNTFDQATPPTGTFKSIASHSRHSCAIATDDTIACWGYHSFAQNASPAGTYKSMAIGWEHTCTIKTDDTISCWGLNDHGEGNFPPGSYKAITAGFVHTCAIKSDDSVICRGMNNRGQTRAPTGSYVSISAGEYHTCALATDGTIACWGDSGSGKTNAPGGTYKSIVARRNHTCAIATDNSVSCWGGNSSGQTDTPSGAFKSTALAGNNTCGIATDGTVKCWGWNVDARSDTPAGTYQSAAMGHDHACAIATDDTISCWGSNEFGQADAPAGTYQHSAAGYDHTCAIGTDDTITCWGYGEHGQTNAPSGTYQSIVAGHDHTCAIGTDDAVACWGLSANGRTIAPPGTYKALSAGSAHTCAIATDDTIICWGDNRKGQTNAPTGTYQSVSAGDDHSCAVTTDRSVACWGSNQDGKARAAVGTYKSVSAGEYHTCAITTDDTISCWGYNKHGQADGPAGTYQSVSMGEFHTCAVATDNTVVCWGNERGRRTSPPDGEYRSIVIRTDHTLAITTDGTLVAWPGLPEGVTWVDGD